MRLGSLGLVAIAIIGLNGLGLHQAQAQPARPCALVCEPPARLDPKTCTCRIPVPGIPKPCSLVCLGPGETLDAAHCRCVRR